MKEKTRKILIMAVMAALIISLMAASLCYAFTYGRYTGGRLDDNSTYDDLIDFVGATAFTVTSPEEFVNAIENGYSYIKIADGAEDPFVINEDIADVYTNLVLDVNGTTVIRNSRNPVLDVRRSISVVLVYDSSEGASGGFYNPVGSALQTSGGSLTIGSGSYESGPNSTVNASLPESQSVSLVTLYTRTSRTAGSYAKVENISMPSLSGDVYYTGDTTQYTYIENDTYLIYTKEENAYESGGQLYVNAKSTTTGEGGNQTTTVTGTQLTPICNVASCDFYYYYPIEENGAYSEDAGTVDSPKTYAVVYGYNDVKGLAEDSTDDTTAVDLREKGLAWPYAAIRSVEDGTVGGVTHARGGTFTTNFGTDNTYGIYSVGGTMTVGTDSTSTPPAFTATGEGTCIRMSAGEDDTLTIASGNFSSQVGDTILMSGGEMTVTGGTFEKDATVTAAQSGEIAANGSAIRVEGGTLNINGTQTGNTKSVTFTITGSNVNGITSPEVTGTPGIVNVTNASFTFNSGSSGTMNYGIAAAGGTVSATSCIFAIPGNDNNGIVVSGGQITASSSTFTLNGDRNNGIYSNITNSTTEENKYDTTAQSCTFNMTGSSNFGVHSEGGKTLVQGSSITMTGTNSSGVYSEGGTVRLSGTSAGTMRIEINESITNNELTCTAVSTQRGTIELSGNVILSSNSLGITAQGNDNATGNITVAEGANVYVGREGSELPATGIYVWGGSITNNGTISVYSIIDDNYTWGGEGFNIYNGIYVQSGSLTSTGTLNVTFTGVESDDVAMGDNADLSYQTVWNGSEYVSASDSVFRKFKVKSYAVRVESTNTNDEVTIAAGEITNDVGGGVLVQGGTVYLGTTGSTAESPNHLKVSATGDTYYGGRAIIGNLTENWYYAPPEKGGDAVKVDGGTLTIHGGEYTANYGNGILVSNGTATVNGGTFTGNDDRDYYGGLYTGAGSNYGLKVLGGSATVKGGTFSSNGGGVFIMGTETNNQQTTITAATIEVSGATAVSLWNYANVVFGTENGNNSLLTASAESTGLAVEKTSDGAEQTITINSGTFRGETVASNKNGIWYGNDATMTINGGIFTGGSSGLFIDVDPGSDKVKISAGTFTGGSGAISGSSPGSITTGDIIVSGSWCFDSEAVLAGNVTDETKRQHAICSYEYVLGTWGQYDYSQVGGGNSIRLTNNVSINGSDSRAFNTLGTIVVAIGDQITYRQ